MNDLDTLRRLIAEDAQKPKPKKTGSDFFVDVLSAVVSLLFFASWLMIGFEGAHHLWPQAVPAAGYVDCMSIWLGLAAIRAATYMARDWFGTFNA